LAAKVLVSHLLPGPLLDHVAAVPGVQPDDPELRVRDEAGPDRAALEAGRLIREALTASGDICPGPGQLLIRLDPLTAPRRTQALAALCDQLNQTASRYPGTDLVLHYEVKTPPWHCMN
jgi:hypothetical protein